MLFWYDTRKSGEVPIYISGKWNIRLCDVHKYIMALYTHCLVARKESTLQEIQIEGFTEKEHEMIRLENVGEVLFQALLFDNVMIIRSNKICMELCTLYRYRIWYLEVECRCLLTKIRLLQNLLLED